MEPRPPASPPLPLPPDLEERLARLAVLQEPLRRSLYLYVVAQGREVGRDEAAEAMGIRRTLAAFHLDRLAEAGLLDTDYRRLSGRTGPGAGRPAKLYRRSPDGHHVSIPPRDYELAAHLLATAMEEGGRRSPRAAVQRVAREFGLSLGEEASRRAGTRTSRRRRLAAVEETLGRIGFEPYREGGEVRLRNCPFHTLARDHQVLACGMNLALVEGLVAGAGADGVEARLDPSPDRCCVVLRPGAVRAG